MRSKALRQERAAIVAQAKAISDQATVTAEEDARFDTLMAEADAIAARIAKAERAEALDAELATARDVTRQVTGASTDKQEHDIKREKRLITAYLGRFTNRLSADDQAAIAQRLDGSGFHAAGSVGTAGAGGYTVPPAFVRELLIAQKAFGGMRAVARSFTTDAGQTLPWPTMDDTANVASIVAENTAGASGTDLAFGQVSMNAWMYRSGYLVLSLELLQDSAFDFDTLIRDALAIRFARGQNAHFTNGTGTGQPQGVITGAASGTVGATGQTTSVIFDDLVNLQHSIDPAYRQGANWMMHDSSIKVLRKLKDTVGRPLFWDDTDDLADGVTFGSLMGAPVIVNQDVPVMAANAKSILYGNFNNYLVRDVLGVTITRLNELFATNGQVGFIAFQRTDGRLISAASPIKYYANSAT